MSENRNVKKAGKKNTVKKNVSKKNNIKHVNIQENKKKPLNKVKPTKRIDNKLSQEELNKELILRVVLIMSYTLIIVFLIMGFVDSLINPISIGVNDTSSYIVVSDALERTKNVPLENASKRFKNLSGNYFIYVSYSGSAEINNFERSLAQLIKKYDLKRRFYYVNIDSIKDNDQVIDLVNSYLGFRDVLVTKVPTIIYVNSDNVVRIENIITRDDDNLMDIGDFQQLLDINNFEEK